MRYSYNTKTARKVARIAFKWCVSYFGHPLKTKTCKLKTDSVSLCDHKGIYFHRQITVNLKMCTSYADVVKTVIHEYTHYLQFPIKSEMKHYHKLVEKFGYFYCPHEVEARDNEKIYYQPCWSHVKKNCKDLQNLLV